MWVRVGCLAIGYLFGLFQTSYIYMTVKLVEQTGIFGCHAASGEYHACGTGGWRDTGISVHVCVI